MAYFRYRPLEHARLTYIFDLEGRFTYINRALLSLWQKPLEDAVGRNFFDLGYPPDLAARLQRQIQQVIHSSEPLKDDTPFTGPTGETRHYEYIFVPVFAADGQVEAVAAGPLPVVRGDTSRLAHVFQNLLSNALKYRRNGVPPQIHVSAEPAGGHWIVSVTDNGIGFDQLYAERIFGLFKRLHTKEYPGTGLGLAICKRIVERCGGRIWAEGMPGEGAAFHFSLPCAA